MLERTTELTRHYADIAPFYDRIAEAGYFDYAGFIGKIQAHITGNEVLEVGVGTGNLTRHLLSRGFHVVGIDCSEPMLELARSKFGTSAPELICANIASFRRPGLFDAAVSHASIFVLVHSAKGEVIETYLADRPQLLRALRNIAASLKPDAKFLFDTYPEHDPNSRFLDFEGYHYEFQIEQLNGMWEFEKRHFIKKDGITVAQSTIRKARILLADFERAALSAGFKSLELKDEIIILSK